MARTKQTARRDIESSNPEGEGLRTRPRRNVESVYATPSKKKQVGEGSSQAPITEELSSESPHLSEELPEQEVQEESPEKGDEDETENEAEGMIQESLFTDIEDELWDEYKNIKVADSFMVPFKFFSQYILGLEDILRPYKTLLEINLPYSLSVVRAFYANLVCPTEGSSFITQVRGVKITITERKLARWLNFDTNIDEAHEAYSMEEVYKTLVEVDEFDGTWQKLEFAAQMSNRFRVLYYVYSRIMVNKAGGFNKLNNTDRELLTCLAKGVTFNMAKHIIDIMTAASDQRQIKYLPYASLVSFILQKSNVWYLEEGEKIKTKEITIQIFHKMGMVIKANVPERARTGKKRRVVQEEGTSSGQAASPGNEAILTRLDTLQQYMASMQLSVDNLQGSVDVLQRDVHDIKSFLHMPSGSAPSDPIDVDEPPPPPFTYSETSPTEYLPLAMIPPTQPTYPSYQFHPSYHVPSSYHMRPSFPFPQATLDPSQYSPVHLPPSDVAKKGEKGKGKGKKKGQ